MTNEQILKKAIKKVYKNGCKDLPDGITLSNDDYFTLEEWAKAVIFRHDFAKAFWGEKVINVCNLPVQDETKGDKPHTHLNSCYYLNWAYQLQQMVLEKDPIKYLESFL